MKQLAFILVMTAFQAFLFQLHADDSTADGKRILVLLEKGFNRTEFWTPADMLRKADHEVVVASTEIGRVPSRLNGEPHPKDTTATLAMHEILDTSGYDALFIPGGYSPGFLEDNPDAIRLARDFMTSGKLVASICHGPRLLMAAGLLEGRVGTMLHTVPSEKPDWWREGRAAAYLDQSVVIDGNLITARYPNDARALGQAILDRLEGVASGPVPSGPRSAYFALWNGFDEAFVLALLPQLEAMGWHVGIAGPGEGWVRGLHGYPLPVDVAYANLPATGLVIAPGGLWPKPGPARQGQTVDWVEVTKPALEARAEWIRGTWQSGGLALLAGLDSELLSGWDKLTGARVAASAQLEWAFPKGGPRWTPDALIETAPGLWTCSGAVALPEVLERVLPKWAAAIPHNETDPD